MDEILLAWIRAARDRGFFLMIAGRLSGIHGWKRTHIPVAYEVVDSTVTIHFDGSERLTISDATDVSMRPDGGLVVRDASEVRFTWNSDKNPDQECEEIFSKGDRLITISRTDDLYTTSTTLSLFEQHFVVLRQ